MPFSPRFCSKGNTRQPDRQLRGFLADLIDGQAEQVLGNPVVATAQADDGLLRMGGGVAGDVRAGVAGTDDHDLLALEFLGLLVGDRVTNLAVELAFDLRHVRIPVAAGGADHGAIQALLATAKGHQPTAIVTLEHLVYRDVQADVGVSGPANRFR